VDGFVLEADRSWYETLSGGGREEAWRDPWAVRDPSSGRYHLFVTAHASHGEADGRGVVGHAWSDDLRRWAVGPPVASPSEFRFMEVPQVERIGARYRLFFCTPAWAHSASRLARPAVSAQTGTHYLVSDELLGPYRLERDEFLLGDEPGSFYAGRVISTPEGWVMLAWLLNDPDGAFVGELSDPMALTVAADGQLWVEID
jgi:beta-fructofuranosidase